ncbi:MAG: glycoside hydrolase family 3 C-terminal domain-containing protein [Lachnospiraceae bacterium]|nr:glycoside hydrolase family 3 C-terminal domain-containing protein [Lachnospiraceae bacterium]
MTNKDKVLWDSSTDIETKLDHILKSLTLDEKLHMLASGSMGVERLSIPDMRLGGEAAHGVEARNDQNGIGNADVTTSFPQPIGMSASWDKAAIKAAGKIVGKEARICYNKRPWGGISRWAPTVDLLRDPRWGRNEEAYGEDPLQTGLMAASYVQGIQGDDKDHLTAAATLKHFYANNTEIGRGWKNSTISPRNKYELYLEPFRHCIEEGGAEGVMTAYNRINGVQGLFNEDVRKLLKEEFGLTHAVSDGGAMELSAGFSHVTAMDAETVARSLKAGVDAMSGNPEAVYAGAAEAYELGILSEEDIDTAIRNVYRTKIRLGLFEENKDDRVNAELCDEEAMKACRELTDESVVLLKNEELLPLKDLKNCVLAGPAGDKWYYDWYGGEAPEHISLFDGLKGEHAKAGNPEGIRYIDGCDRIYLKCGDKYLSVDEDACVRLGDKADIFILEDWGEGSYTFRNENSGKYMITRFTDEKDKSSTKIVGKVAADADKIFSWFDLEVFRLEEEGGKLILKDRFGNRIYADKEGYLFSAKEEDEELTALSFETEIISKGYEEAVKAASGAETVILALGHCPMVNAKEETDRSTIEFIPYQQKLFDEIYKVNKNIIVVLMSDYPYAINEINEKAAAVIWSATGSQCMGRALAGVITGSVHPAGRLTQSWYKKDDDLPDIDDYDIIGKGRTYRYFDGEVLYPFGYGLTYTAFEYSELKLDIVKGKSEGIEAAERKICGQPVGVYDKVRNDGRTLHVELSVTNTGEYTSDEVVQVYAKAPEGSVKKAIKQLIDFERVKDIAAGETRKVQLEIPLRELAYYDVVSEKLIVEKGSYEICVGASSEDIRLSAKIDVDGDARAYRELSKKIKADHYDEESGTQIVEGMYGYSALMAKTAGVYEPPANGKIRVTYKDCDMGEDAQTFRIHGYAPENADIRIYIDDVLTASLTLNTREYEKRPAEARNHMPRAAEDDRLRRESWPLLWADIYIPLDISGIDKEALKGKHVVRIEADGPFKYDWFMMI